MLLADVIDVIYNYDRVPFRNFSRSLLSARLRFLNVLLAFSRLSIMLSASGALHVMHDPILPSL